MIYLKRLIAVPFGMTKLAVMAVILLIVMPFFAVRDGMKLDEGMPNSDYWPWQRKFWK